MMTINAVLQVGPLLPALQDAVNAEFGAVRLPETAPERAAFLADRRAEFAVAVTTGRFGVGSELMAELPNLRAVVNFGVGYDTTDVAQAKARGIAVSNTPDVLNDCVADTAVGLYLDVLRRFTASDRYVRRGDWLAKGNFPLAVKASGKRVGIVGLGRIGRVIARRLEGFDCVVAYHNRRPVEGVGYEYVDSLVELARRSDALIVATAGGPDSAGLISAEVIDALGADGYLINIARGSVVDEQALIRALADGRLAGAGLDVFVEEPVVPQELLDMDNVVVLPHVGSGTHETRAGMAQLTLSNLRQFINKGTLETPVI